MQEQIFRNRRPLSIKAGANTITKEILSIIAINHNSHIIRIINNNIKAKSCEIRIIRLNSQTTHLIYIINKNNIISNNRYSHLTT